MCIIMQGFAREEKRKKIAQFSSFPLETVKQLAE